jgi:hypothetical protein
VSYDCYYDPDIPEFVLVNYRVSYDCYYDPDIPDFVVVD